MMKNGTLFFIYVLSLISVFSCSESTDRPIKEESFEQRAKTLVAQMTLEEKVSQTRYDSPAIPRLNIPAHNWWNECLHGVARSGIATVFPQAIGMAAMWDDSTMYDIATVISDEARAKHHAYVKEGKRNIYQGLTFWTPNINIFRDPRWGRGMETYGEDPYLTGKLGVSFIKGLQGNHDKYYKLIATAKHFAVHSGPEVSRHRFDARPSVYDFMETYSPQFEMAVKEAGVYSVMCAYNRYNGVPCCGDKRLSDLLRNDWGFNGYIVSDCWAVRDFYDKDAHEIVNTKAEAAAISIKAGTDLNCGNSYPALNEAVEKGFVTEKEIDLAVERLILARMKLGMFDSTENVPYASIPYSVVDSDKHKALALEAARKSIVLLKNQESILPLSKKVESVAVIGPNAHNEQMLWGNYHGYPSETITPYQGIKAKLPKANVRYAPGCVLAEGLPMLEAIPTEILFTDKSKTTNGLKAEYFNNIKHEGEAELTRTDANIDFKWWNKGPGEPISGYEFSARWTGVIVPQVSGKYAIGGEAHSGFKLWLNGDEITARGSEHHAQKEYEFIDLNAGEAYDIKVEYIQNRTEYAHVSLLWEVPGQDLKEKALGLVRESDVVVLFMGLSPLLEGEEMKVKVEGFSHGDRDHIQLPEVQADLIKSVYKLGKPTVLVLHNGSALAFNWEKKNIPAIVEAWYGGQAAGTAIADVLFGDYNPSGKLPLTFYKTVKQLPPFDDYNMEGRTYRYFTGEPLYEFGYGLSYTSFSYEIENAPQEYEAGEELKIAVKITNTGNVDGEDVAQLYVEHTAEGYRLPIRTLKGFKRVALKAGESKTVEFALSPKDVALLSKTNEYEIAKETLKISIGGQQPSANAIKAKQVVETEIEVNISSSETFLVNR